MHAWNSLAVDVVLYFSTVYIQCSALTLHMTRNNYFNCENICGLELGLNGLGCLSSVQFSVFHRGLGFGFGFIFQAVFAASSI